MAFGAGTRQWMRGLTAKIAASTAVLGSGELLVSDKGVVYGGDGTTQIKNLSPALTQVTASNTYVALGPAPTGDTTGVADSATLAAAVAALPTGADPSGGHIVLRPGVYYVSSEFQNAQKVTVWGDASRATIIRCGSAWSSAGGKTSVVAIGTRAGGGTPLFGTVFKRMTIDAAGLAATCVYSNQANEQSGIEDVVLLNFTTVGGDFAAGCQNLRVVDDVEAYSTNVSGVTAGLRFTTNVGACRVGNVTVVGNSSSPMSAGVIVDGTSIHIDSVHVEAATDGALVRNGSFAVVDMLDVSSNVTNALHIASTNNAAPVVARVVKAGSASGVAVLDDIASASVLGAVANYAGGSVTGNQPQKSKTVVMGSDIGGATNTAPANLLAGISFTPTGKSALVLLKGIAAQTNPAGQVFFTVVANGTTYNVAVLQASAGATWEQPILGAALVTGLTPGTAYTVQTQYHVDASPTTFYCRPVGQAGREFLICTIEDAA